MRFCLIGEYELSPDEAGSDDLPAVLRTLRTNAGEQDGVSFCAEISDADSSVLIHGNPVDGFKVIGPFITAEDANYYADEVRVHNRTLDGDWWIAGIEPAR